MATIEELTEARKTINALMDLSLVLLQLTTDVRIPSHIRDEYADKINPILERFIEK